jgi:hypothetical protein
MSKTLSAIIGLSALIIAGSVAYYCFNALPAQQNDSHAWDYENSLRAIGTNCSKDGMYAAKNYATMNGAKLISNPTFHFSEKYAKCYVSLEVSGYQNCEDRRTIIDAATNADVLSMCQSPDGKQAYIDNTVYPPEVIGQSVYIAKRNDLLEITADH